MEAGPFHLLLPGVPGVTSRGYLGYCSQVLFRCGGQWGVFDTGHQSDRHLLIAALAEKGLAPADIGLVVLSHLHFDHSLNLPIFPRARVYLSQAELDYAQAVTDGRLVDHSEPDHWRELLAGRELVVCGEALDLPDGLRLERYPGHTPGCLALLHPASRTAVCGDAIKNAWEAVERGGRHGPGRPGPSRATSRGFGAGPRCSCPGMTSPFRLEQGDVTTWRPWLEGPRHSSTPNPRASGSRAVPAGRSGRRNREAIEALEKSQPETRRGRDMKKLSVIAVALCLAGFLTVAQARPRPSMS